MHKNNYFKEKIKIYHDSAASNSRLSHGTLDDRISKPPHSYFNTEDSGNLAHNRTKKQISLLPPPPKSPERHLEPQNQRYIDTKGRSRLVQGASTPLTKSSEYSYSEYTYSYTSRSTSSNASGRSSAGSEGRKHAGKVSHPATLTRKDLELAAAAACNAILEKERSLKKLELKLLNEKQYLLDEVKRQTLHDNTSLKSNTIACLQKIVVPEDSNTNTVNYMICDSPQPCTLEGSTVEVAGDPTRGIACSSGHQSEPVSAGYPTKVNDTFSSQDTPFGHVREQPKIHHSEGDRQNKFEEVMHHSPSSVKHVTPPNKTLKADSTPILSDKTVFIRVEKGRIVKDVSAERHVDEKIEGQPLQKPFITPTSLQPDGKLELPIIVSAPDLVHSSQLCGTNLSTNALSVLDTSPSVENRTKDAPHAEVDEGASPATAIPSSDAIRVSDDPAKELTLRKREKNLHAEQQKLSDELSRSPGPLGPADSLTAKRTSRTASGSFHMPPQEKEISVESPEHPQQVIQCSPIPYYGSEAQSLSVAHPANQGSRTLPPPAAITLFNSSTDPSNRFLWNPNVKTVPSRSKGIKDFFCTEYVPLSTSREPALPTEPVQEENQPTVKAPFNKHDKESSARRPSNSQRKDPQIFEPFAEEGSAPAANTKSRPDDQKGSTQQATLHLPDNNGNTISNTDVNRAAYPPQNFLSLSRGSSIVFPTPPCSLSEKKRKPCCCGRNCNGCSKGKKKSGSKELFQCLFPWFKRRKKNTDPHQPTTE